MMRQIALGTGFIGVTLGLLWFGLAPMDQPNTDFNEVSRSEPDLMGLTPALPKPTAATETVVVVETPTAATFQGPSEEFDAIEALRAMSYGIMNELQVPAPKTQGRQQAALTPVVTPRPVSVHTQPQTGKHYTVQKGDSLPGLAFRFYGTTVAYMQIIDANPDQLNDPSDLRAGMTLTIPEIK